MPTNEERRYVAERLREINTNEWICYGHEFDELMTASIMTACGCNFGQDWQDIEICNRLAELIEQEPERTCRMEINWDYDGDCPSYYRDYVCSECKEDFIYYKNSSVNYCPNCGAKVVD